MKILKWILIVIVSLIAIVLISALFMPKDYAIEVEVVINKPKQDVFNYIKYIKNQDHYSKWNMKDPAMGKEYSGTDGTIGFVYKWDSKVVGKGEQEIAKITEGDRMDMNLHFIKPWEGKAQSYMSTETTGDNQTKVKWGLAGSSPYPMNFMSVVMKSMLTNDLQTGLNNLKGVMEKQ